MLSFQLQYRVTNNTNQPTDATGMLNMSNIWCANRDNQLLVSVNFDIIYIITKLDIALPPLIFIVLNFWHVMNGRWQKWHKHINTKGTADLIFPTFLGTCITFFNNKQTGVDDTDLLIHPDLQHLQLLAPSHKTEVLVHPVFLYSETFHYKSL